MAEYIEKQAVLDEIDEEIQEFPECEYALSFSKRWIKKLPPADVRPVRRGRWILYSTDKWVCSECKVGNKYAYSWDSNTKDYTHLQDFFCPRCGSYNGADMRGGDAE